MINGPRSAVLLVHKSRDLNAKMFFLQRTCLANIKKQSRDVPGRFF